jgi:ssDNA-binding Zn-finger/Zn-ribbon topoisomerase 1
MKILIHGTNVNCNHKHVHETYKQENITCSACKYVLYTNKTALEDFIKLGNIDKFIQKKRILDLDKKLANNRLKGLICDKCLKKMVKRINTKNNTHFFGCSGYPYCKNTLPYTPENITIYSKKK